MNSGLGSFPRGLGDLLLWLVPVGAGFEWWGTEADTPRGYLLQDGTVYPISKYPKLAKRLGNRHGGDGVTTFGVPDRRGRVAVGKDDMGGTAASRVTSGVSGVAGNTLGAVGGDQRAQAHGHTASQGTHSHNVTLWGDNPGGGISVANAGGVPLGSTSAGPVTNPLVNVGVTDAQSAGAITVNSSGSGASENMPPSIVCNHIIRAA